MFDNNKNINGCAEKSSVRVHAAIHLLLFPMDPGKASEVGNTVPGDFCWIRWVDFPCCLLPCEKLEQCQHSINGKGRNQNAAYIY